MAIVLAKCIRPQRGASSRPTYTNRSVGRGRTKRSYGSCSLNISLGGQMDSPRWAPNSANALAARSLRSTSASAYSTIS